MIYLTIVLFCLLDSHFCFQHVLSVIMISISRINCVIVTILIILRVEAELRILRVHSTHGEHYVIARPIWFLLFFLVL